MSNAITVKNVTKNYGSSRGVRNVSLALEQGSVMGFLGPNGAGKTTTISMLVDLIRPSKGTIEIFGLDTTKHGVEIRRRIGFLAGDFSLDEDLTGWQQLTYFANLRGGIDKAYVAKLAKRLSSDLSRQIKTLSRGNRQKIGLISALMHDPELLIFDEPTSGLDPLVQAEFNIIIRERKAQGKAAFISSHLLSEVQEICDEVAFIREGKLIAVQNMQELAEGLPKQLTIYSKDQGIQKALSSLKALHLRIADNGKYVGTYQGGLNELMKVLAQHDVADMEITEADLETVFMKYYGAKP